MTVKESTTKRWRYYHPDAPKNADPVFIVEADTLLQSIEVRTPNFHPARIAHVLDNGEGSTAYTQLLHLIAGAFAWLKEQSWEVHESFEQEDK